MTAFKKLAIAAVVITAMAGVLYSVRPERPIEPPMNMAEINQAPFTKPEIEALIGALFGAMDTSRAENRYVPSFAKQKFEWIMEQNHRGLLKINLNDTTLAGETVQLAAAFYDTSTRPPMPAIAIFVRPLAKYQLPGFRISKTIDPVLKDNFYVLLTHEVIHLEQDRQSFLTPVTREQRLQSEMRAWAITSKEVVRPLSLQGREIFNDLLVSDKMLQACHDDWQNCPDFRKFVADRIGPS
jgi:hypothetical protein